MSPFGDPPVTYPWSGYYRSDPSVQSRTEFGPKSDSTEDVMAFLEQAKLAADTYVALCESVKAAAEKLVELNEILAKHGFPHR
jgi:hypothetical protein